MDREKVTELAKIASEKKTLLHGLAACNTFGLTHQERVDLDARYMMAQDEALAAEAAYLKALAEYLA